MESQGSQQVERNVDMEAVRQVEEAMNQQAKRYIYHAIERNHARLWIGIVVAFSVSNLIIPYLMNVPVISWILDMVMEMFEWGGNMIPAATLPKTLLSWQVAQGQWGLGVVYALVALVPFGLGLLATKKRGKVGGYWLVFGWYAVDTALFVWQSVTLFVDALDADVSLWKMVMFVVWSIVDVIFRLVVFSELVEAIVIPKKTKKEWDKLVDLSFSLYAVVHGEEAARKQPRKYAEAFAHKWMLSVAQKAGVAQCVAQIQPPTE